MDEFPDQRNRHERPCQTDGTERRQCRRSLKGEDRAGEEPGQDNDGHRLDPDMVHLNQDVTKVERGPTCAEGRTDRHHRQFLYLNDCGLRTEQHM